jgi:hypothetical protein
MAHHLIDVDWTGLFPAKAGPTGTESVRGCITTQSAGTIKLRGSWPLRDRGRCLAQDGQAFDVSRTGFSRENVSCHPEKIDSDCAGLFPAKAGPTGDTERPGRRYPAERGNDQISGREGVDARRGRSDCGEVGRCATEEGAWHNADRLLMLVGPALAGKTSVATPRN